MRSKTGRVYVITHYTFLRGGECVPLVKYDVTGQFDYICREKMSRQEVSLSPPEESKAIQDSAPVP